MKVSTFGYGLLVFVLIFSCYSLSYVMSEQVSNDVIEVPDGLMLTLKTGQTNVRAQLRVPSQNKIDFFPIFPTCANSCENRVKFAYGKGCTMEMYFCKDSNNLSLGRSGGNTAVGYTKSDGVTISIDSENGGSPKGVEDICKVDNDVIKENPRNFLLNFSMWTSSPAGCDFSIKFGPDYSKYVPPTSLPMPPQSSVKKPSPFLIWFNAGNNSIWVFLGICGSATIITVPSVILFVWCCKQRRQKQELKAAAMESERDRARSVIAKTAVEQQDKKSSEEGMIM